MQDDDDNFFGDDLPETSDTASTTQRVIETFKELMAAEEELEQTDEILKGLKAKVGKIKTETFPTLLNEMGTEIWRDPETGVTVELVTSVDASLPKDREKRNEVLNALRPIGIEEILGEEFNIVFIPNDKRASVMRRLLGIPEPILNVVEDEEEPEVPKLSNLEIFYIEEFIERLELSNMPAEEKLGVHPSRLSAWLKRRIEDGKGTEIRDAGIWHGKSATVQKPKAEKAKK